MSMTDIGERYGSFEMLRGNSRAGEVNVVDHREVIDDRGRQYLRRFVSVSDESNADPELRQRHIEKGEQLEQDLVNSPEWRSTISDDGRVVVHEENAAARWLYYDEHGRPTQMLQWAARFPTAIALEPLQRLSRGGKWLPGGSIDDRSLELFTYMIDGIGLRTRGRIYADALVRVAESLGNTSLSIVSLGSGAAVPNIAATKKLEQLGVAVDWQFFDFDSNALLFARALIEEEAFLYSTFDYGPLQDNVPTGRSYVRAFSLPEASIDVVDALGLWEYLRPKEAIRFAARLYEKLKPGGTMIVSNMLPTRPQLDLNQRAVGWPGLYLRDESALLDMLAAAGIDSRAVTMTHSEDGVYVVMEAKKAVRGATAI